MPDDPPAPYDLLRAGTTTPLLVDLALADQTLADGTHLVGVTRINFEGGEGADTVLGGAYADTLIGNGGADSLSGGAGADVLVGAAGDTLLGGEGDDQITISAAAAMIRGGAGSDVLTITGNSTFVAGGLSEVEQVYVYRGVKADFSKLTVGQNVAQQGGTGGGVYLIGGSGADTLIGSTSGDTLEGGSGSDVLQGGDGNDRLSGGPGNDSMFGGNGDDVLETKRGTGPDYFDGGAGTDRVVADFLTANVAMHLDLTDTTVLQDLGGGAFMINVEVVNFTAGLGNDTLIGGALNDTLNGGDGDDIIGGAGGNDRIYGGAGTDTAVFSGARSEYSALLNGSLVQIADRATAPRDGTDQLSDVEVFQFVDGTFTLAQLLQPAVTDIALSGDTAPEGAAVGTVVGVLSASVDDATPNVAYGLAPDEARFSLSGSQLVLAQSLAAGVYQVSVTATDSRGGERQETFDITVGDGEAPPVGLQVSNLQGVAENTAAETRLADVVLTNAGPETYAYSVNDARFAVHDGGLYLKAGQAVDYETHSTIPLTITATSSAGAVSTNIVVGVSDVDEAPTAVTVSNLVSLAENTAAETRLADVAIADPDTDPAKRVYTYSVDDARFAVHDGGLYLKAGQTVDYETQSTIPLTITATSSAGAVSTNIVVGVSDVDEAPTAVTVSNLVSLAENTAAETRLADVAIADPDTDPAKRVYTYSVDDARFAVHDGGLYLKAGQTVDYETQPTIPLTITATSSAGAVSTNIVVGVTDVAEGTVPYDLLRAGTTTPLLVDLALADQTLADGTHLVGVTRINFEGGEGADTVLGGAYADTLIGNGGADSLSGGAGADVLVGAAGDTLLGGEGDDQITISAAAAMIRGGAGSDVLTITGNSTFVAGGLSEVEQVYVYRGVKADFSKLTVGQNVAQQGGTGGGVYLIGGSGADTLIGSASGDTLEGGSGSDILQGGDGNDRLSGGPGNDSMFGGNGDDVLETKRGTGPDYFDGGAGTDRVVADFLTANVAMHLDLTDTTVLQDLGGGAFMINVEVVNFTAGLGNDTLIGGALNDTLNGGDGDDIIGGADGNDSLMGSTGYDIAVFSGAYSDYTIVNLSAGQYRVTGPGGVDVVSGFETFRFADGDRAVGGDSASAVYWGSTNASMQLISATNMPDGRGATPGTGFTITGLVRAPDGTWWAANEGQAEEDDNTYTPSLVHLAADRETKIGEIIFGPATIRAVQGLTFRPESNELLVASLSESKIRVYDATTGEFVKFLTTDVSPNALTYDSLLDAYVIGADNNAPNSTVVRWRSYETGDLIKSLDVGVIPDHIYFDPAEGAQGTLYITYGENNQAGKVDKRDVATGELLGRYVVPEANAVEGIYVDGDHVYLANDAYFHKAAPKLNRILEFVASPIASAYDRGTATTAFNVDLSIHSQTLSDGTQLVGVDRIFFKAGSGADFLRGGAFDDVLVGLDGADTLDGAGGADRLVGAAGDDVLTGGAGDDRVEGGAGFDTAVFSGLRSNYNVESLSSTGVRVTATSGDDGSDIVSDVEMFQFLDGTFTLAQLLQPAPPVGLQVSNLQGVAENTAAETRLADVVLTNAGPETYAYSVNDARFAVHDGGLYLKAGQAVDYETQSTIPLTITATSSAGVVSTNIVVGVSDVDEAPTAVTVSNLVSLAENTAAETRLADVAIADPDTDPAKRVYTYSVNDARFAVHDGGLYLKAGQAVDYETQSTIPLTITATSSAGVVSTNIVVGVSDVDEAPTAVTVSNLQSIAENTAAETRLADVAIADPDTDPAKRVYTYSVDDARFTVHDGGLYLKAGQTVDYETQPTINLNVTATSPAGSISTGVVVTVTDVAEAGPAVTISNLQDVAENTAAETRLADVTMANAGSQTYTYSVDDARFTVHDGGLYLKAGQAVDYETQPTIPLTITATSSAGAVSTDIVVGVGDVDEAPTAVTVSNLQSIAENTAAETRLADVAIADPDTDPAKRVYTYSVDDDRFAVHDGGLYLKAGQAVDYETQPTIPLTITATSSAGAVSANIVVGVTDVAEGTIPYDLLRAGTTTPLLVDLALADQTLADGTHLVGVTRINFEGGEGADTVLGGAYADTLIGNGGADSLSGGAGADVLVGAAGDTLLGGEGDDQITISAAAAMIRGGAGSDVLTITGNSTFVAGSLSEVEQIYVHRGVKADFSKLNVGQNVAQQGGTGYGVYLIGGSSSDTLIGSTSGDTLEGGSGSDILQGGDGNDRLSGGPGNDSMFGGNGDDVLETKRGTGPDYFDGGAGTDRVVADFLTANVSMHLDLTDTTVLQDLGGGAFMVNVEFVEFTSGLKDDVLIGGALNDTLNGGAGDDFIMGGGGNDRLTGSTGADTFAFAGAWGVDTILDFEKNVDHIDMRGTGLTFGDLQFSASGTSTTVHVAGFGDINILNTAPSVFAADDFIFT